MNNLCRAPRYQGYLVIASRGDSTERGKCDGDVVDKQDQGTASQRFQHGAEYRTRVRDVSIRRISDLDRAWVREFIATKWGAETIIAHGVLYRPAELDGFVAIQNDGRVGLIALYIQDNACEIVMLASTQSNRGIGTRFIESAIIYARERGCARLWLITTNDNLNALGFYQKRGFRLVAIHRGAVDVARKIKPEIPLIGDNRIPLRDEIELEMML